MDRSHKYSPFQARAALRWGLRLCTVTPSDAPEVMGREKHSKAIRAQRKAEKLAAD